MTESSTDLKGWRNDSRGGGTRLWGPPRKRVLKCLKGPKTTYTTIAIAEKPSKRSKKAHYRYILVHPGPTQEVKLMAPGGEGPSRSPPPPPGFSSRADLRNTSDMNGICRKNRSMNETADVSIKFLSKIACLPSQINKAGKYVFDVVYGSLYNCVCVFCVCVFSGRTCISPLLRSTARSGQRLSACRRQTPTLGCMESSATLYQVSGRDRGEV